MAGHHPRVAVVWGGNTGEYEISRRSALRVMEALKGFPLEPWLVEIRGSHWQVLGEGLQCALNKDDFSFLHPAEGRKLSFDVVYNIIHGSPGEDGRLQGYLDMIGMPYTGCGFRTSLITMNKYLCKQMLREVPVGLAASVLVRRGFPIDFSKIVDALGLPLFVKPANGGSSLGTHKVKSAEDLEPALEDAFLHDAEVMCETFIPGRELTCGVVGLRDEIHALPVTEIIPHREFFDYAAKYEGASSEVTPAAIAPELTALLQEKARLVYKALHCRGIVRVDFILTKEGIPYFLEVNTVPGFSAQSIVPQQLIAAGLNPGQVIFELISEALQSR
ncbi:MAG: D-alanine--D-alanine ligase [Flavobacteriales bacterium]|nr:D-alanine--D-alanine ligase [Flavobacteriales bacterium]MCX7650240.1 D-alanine--D-alanine ligase [Flavobacteriales bacterium]MDW8431166.1 D-alanine--D-alanine ligase family protein [Flavobacteriales bacterium]